MQDLLAKIEIKLATMRPTDLRPKKSRGGAFDPVIVLRIIQQKTSANGNPVKQSKSSFFDNGQPILAKVLREQIQKNFSILIDNLCTFLPQDRVGSFSGFNSKALNH